MSKKSKESMFGVHSSFSNPRLRNISQLDITERNLMYPIFISNMPDIMEPTTSMPDVGRFGYDKVCAILEPLVAVGLQSVLLFGVLDRGAKDKEGSLADSSDNPVIRALPLITKRFPDLLVACDVCLCSYTLDGHCGIVRERAAKDSVKGIFNKFKKETDVSIDNERSIRRIAEIAVAYAKAGAHIVAPSDMMDGRVLAIKNGLRDAGLGQSVAVLSYSAKFASVLYGPFREASKTALVGDRKSYQLPPSSAGLAARAVDRDCLEGADMLMVKPASFYLDIIHQTKQQHPERLLFAYQVSGEYLMIQAASAQHVFNLKDAVMESMTAFLRAGADVVITYFTPELLYWIREERSSSSADSMASEESSTSSAAASVGVRTTWPQVYQTLMVENKAKQKLAEDLSKQTSVADGKKKKK